MHGEHLTGNYRVRAIRPAFSDVARLCCRTTDKLEIRRHALKLRLWPAQHPTDRAGRVLDLDWSWVRALENKKVGELRVEDEIGGNDNLRIIFFVGPPEVRKPLPLIWILRVLQKKRDDFSTHDLSIFKARRAIVLQRFYDTDMN